MSPRGAAAKEEFRNRQRERIASAAAKVFARRGYLGTKVSDIAAAAGVSHGLVHHYFGSKAEVFIAIIRTTMDQGDALPQALLGMPGSHRERLEWFASVILEGVKALPEVFFLAVEAVANAAAPEEARRLVVEKGPVAIQTLSRFIAAGQAAGDFRAGDPTALANHLMAQVQGLALQRLGQTGPLVDPDAGILVGLIVNQEKR